MDIPDSYLRPLLEQYALAHSELEGVALERRVDATVSGASSQHFPALARGLISSEYKPPNGSQYIGAHYGFGPKRALQLPQVSTAMADVTAAPGARGIYDQIQQKSYAAAWFGWGLELLGRRLQQPGSTVRDESHLAPCTCGAQSTISNKGARGAHLSQ